MIARNKFEPSELTIFGRIVGDDRQNLTPELSHYLLKLGFGAKDKSRMHRLAVRNQAGELSEHEAEELAGYAKAACLLGIFQSKARKSLKRPKGRTPQK